MTGDQSADETEHGDSIFDHGGPVDSGVSHFRDAPVLIRFPVIPGVACPRCGSGEVYEPMQAMDMPMKLKCLLCGMGMVQ